LLSLRQFNRIAAGQKAYATGVLMSAYEFSDVTAARKQCLDAMARQSKIMTPLTWLLRGVFAVARLLRFEAWLFRHFFKPFAGMFATAIGKAFTDYTPTEHDVFVCSYYKCGTNWVMNIAYQVAEKGTGEFEDILDVAPWADCPSPETTIQAFQNRAAGNQNPRPCRVCAL
jgi:hypothetical protein